MLLDNVIQYMVERSMQELGDVLTKTADGVELSDQERELAGKYAQKIHDTLNPPEVQQAPSLQDLMQQIGQPGYQDELPELPAIDPMPATAPIDPAPVETETVCEAEVVDDKDEEENLDPEPRVIDITDMDR